MQSVAAATAATPLADDDDALKFLRQYRKVRFNSSELSGGQFSTFHRDWTEESRFPSVSAGYVAFTAGFIMDDNMPGRLPFSVWLFLSLNIFLPIVDQFAEISIEENHN